MNESAKISTERETNVKTTDSVQPSTSNSRRDEITPDRGLKLKSTKSARKRKR